MKESYWNFFSFVQCSVLTRIQDWRSCSEKRAGLKAGGIWGPAVCQPLMNVMVSFYEDSLPDIMQVHVKQLQGVGGALPPFANH